MRRDAVASFGNPHRLLTTGAKAVPTGLIPLPEGGETKEEAAGPDAPGNGRDAG